MSISKDKIEYLAKKYAWVETIETRNRDSLDFHDMHIANIVSLIREAYEMGKTDAENKD